MDDILDSLGNPLEEGKYYQLDIQPRAKYTGPSDTGSVFNFKPPKGRIVVRTLERLQASPPVRLGAEAGDETDEEYESPFDNKFNKFNNNNIYDSDTDDEENLDLGDEDINGGKRRRKKTRRHRKKTRKHRRKTRKHRKKSRKHRKR
jgi:hypothetical protein